MVTQKKILRLIALVLLTAALLAMFTNFTEDNEGTPGRRTDQENCGLNDGGCHQTDEDASLSVYTTGDKDDFKLFAAPLEKEGSKLSPDDYERQVKAVAVDGDSDYIHWLENQTKQDGQLDLSSYGPEDGEEFWVGYGFINSAEEIHVYVTQDAYLYRKNNEAPVPAVNISSDSSYPEDERKTIRPRMGDDEQTLDVYFSRESKEVTVFLTGAASYDPDGQDDDLEHYWDLDSDGKYEDGEGPGEDRDETGMSHEWVYNETGNYTLKYRVADGKTESSSIYFYINVNDVPDRPEYQPQELTVKDDQEAEAVGFVAGETVYFNCSIWNGDGKDHNKASADKVGATLYYCLESEDYLTWYLIGSAETNAGIPVNDSGEVVYFWDTTDLGADGYGIKLVVDDGNSEDEWNETNNEAFAFVKIRVKMIPEYSPGSNPSPIARTPGSQSNPSIYGDIVVWQDKWNGEWDIFMIDLDAPGEIIQISNTSADLGGAYETHMHSNPMVYGYRVFWLYEWWDFNVHEYYLVEYNLRDPIPGGTVVHEIQEIPFDMKFSEKWVTWTQMDNSRGFDLFSLYAYNIWTNSAVEVMDFDGNYALDYHLLMFFDEPQSQVYGEEQTIFVKYNMSTEERKEEVYFSTNPMDISYPSVDGYYAVWEDERLDDSTIFEDGNTDIYLLDLKEGQLGQLTTNLSSQEEPVVQGDYVIWKDKRSDKSSIYAYSVSRNKTAVLVENGSTASDPVVSGDKVVWTHELSYNSANLYVYDLTKASWGPSEAIFGDLIKDAPGKELTVILDEPLDGSIVNGTVEISGEASPLFGANDDNEVRYRIDNGEWEEINDRTYYIDRCFWATGWDSSKVKNGEHTISVKVTNGTAWSEVISITVTVENEGGQTGPGDDDGDDTGFLPGFQLAGLLMGILLSMYWKGKP
jgi:beta propeller repeat protein